MPDLLQHALEQRVDALAVDERRLDVHLGELHLAVGAQVLVAEAPGDLEVFLHAGDHQDLLELLRRLRERVELARVDARRHEVLARALGRALEQRGRLDLDEFLGVKIIAHGLRRLVPHQEVFLHLGPAQVEIAVGQAQVLVDLVATGVVERERRRVGDVEDLEPVGRNLDLAGGQRGVDGAVRAHHDLAADGDHRLRLEVGGLRAEAGVVLRVELHLREALAVAQVDEDDAAVVADGIHPAQ